MECYKYYDAIEFKGKTLLSAVLDEEYAAFSFSDGSEYEMFHRQDCCESVRIHDVLGDIDSLYNHEIIDSVEQSGADWPSDVPAPKYLDSYTWTIYTFKTKNSEVSIRWLGESNGYYSESVEIKKIKATI